MAPAYTCVRWLQSLSLTLTALGIAASHRTRCPFSFSGCSADVAWNRHGLKLAILDILIDAGVVVGHRIRLRLIDRLKWVLERPMRFNLSLGHILLCLTLHIEIFKLFELLLWRHTLLLLLKKMVILILVEAGL